MFLHTLLVWQCPTGLRIQPGPVAAREPSGNPATRQRGNASATARNRFWVPIAMMVDNRQGWSMLAIMMVDNANDG